VDQRVIGGFMSFFDCLMGTLQIGVVIAFSLPLLLPIMLPIVLATW